jgi:hypothetical protein
MEKVFVACLSGQLTGESEEGHEKRLLGNSVSGRNFNMEIMPS